MKISQPPAVPQNSPQPSAENTGETPRPSRVAGGTSVIKAELAAPLLPPLKLTKFKHYELLELIGRGGMGDVYRARDEQTNRVVAVKALSAELTRDEQFVKRFEREARALAKLEHPHIVPVYDIDRDQGHVFFVMQYVAGESLDRRLRRAGKPTMNAALRIISQCVQALSAAHAQQLVHRDVKPGNVLLQEGTDHVYLVDFGLVRRVDSNTSFTEAGVVMGTVDYMSPEQARGSANIDHRADLYSIGVMLYHLLSGRLPFEAPSFQGMLYSHAYETPQPIAEVVPDLPAPLVELTSRLLAKSPHGRPANCGEVLAVLEPLLRIEVRAQHLQTEITSAADDRGSEPLQIAASIVARRRWADRIASLVKSPSRQAQESLQDELHSAIAAVEQRIAYFTGLKSEGEQLCGELRQQGTDDAPANEDASDVEASSFHGHAESIRLRLMPIELELNRALHLRAKLAAVAARTKLVERPSKGSQTSLALSIVVAAACLLVGIGLVAAIASWFGRTGHPSSAAGTLPTDVYLDDFPETFAHVGHGSLGKHGSTGFAGASGETPSEVIVDGKKVMHALSSHPGKNDAAKVSYDLGGNYRSFTSRVGLIDKPTVSRFQGEMIFRVLGDDRELWRSASVRIHGQSITTSIDVTGVQRLSLVVECVGPHYCGWAVWLEPKLSAVALSDAWHDLLANVDLERDRVLGTIERKQNGIKFHPIERTLLTLPANLPAQYDLEYEFSGFGGGGFELLLPVGDRMVNAYFGCWGNTRHGIFRVRGQDDAPGAFQNGALEPGKRYRAAVQVRQNGTQAMIVLWLNSEKVLAWTGNVADLSLNPAFEAAQHGSASATTYKGDVTLHSARFRASAEPLQMLSGHVDGKELTTSASAENHFVTAKSAWKQGDLPSARREYEVGLKLDPDNLYEQGHLAMVCLAMNDLAAYQEHCRSLLAQFAKPQVQSDYRAKLQILRTITHHPQGAPDYSQFTISEHDLKSAPTWAPRTQIALHYRSGRWNETIAGSMAYFAKNGGRHDDWQPMLFSAMAHWHTNQQESAKQLLITAARSFASSHSQYSDPGKAPSHEVLYANLLYGEATQLILGTRQELTAISGAKLPGPASPIEKKTGEARPFAVTPPEQPPNTLSKASTGARASSPQPAESATYLEGPVEPLTTAVQQSPLDANAWIRRSRWHLVRQNWKEARADCEQYLQLKPDNMWVRREHLDLCMALEEKNPQSYYVVAEYVRSLPSGRFALGDLRSLCLIPAPPEIAPSDLATWAARSGHPKTISANVYLPAVHYRAGDWQTCAAAAAQTFPNGPQGLFQVVPCLFEAAALKQLEKDTEARRKLATIRDFVEKGKSTSYPGKRDEVILNLTFDSLHSQIFFREASELILGTREELKAPLAMEIVNRESSGK